jgi:hypothetical protein
MDYESLRLLAGLLCGLCLAQTVWIIVLHSQRDEARDMAGFVAQAVEDIARGKAKAFMHMGRVHITNDMGE